jgi:molybdopterin-guanine dinucleotide biosynthesis protein A
MAGPSPLGIVLAGGAGRRLGGAKAKAQLCGRPLISYPLRALEAVLGEAMVVAKADTELPDLGTGRVWIEREHGRHPLVGLIEALARAGGRDVVVCAVDLPLVTPALVASLAFHPAQRATAVLASHRGETQPLLARYGAHALAPLQAADPGIPLREAVQALSPTLFEVGDPVELFNVNTPADLERAAELLCGPRVSPRSPTSSSAAG